MSFRKRNLVVGSSARGPARGPVESRQEASHPTGVRASPLDGRLTTSTGTSSLDQLLAGHAGLPLGCSLLFEESGTTDFSGVLLRYYAAEGLVQGHKVHVLGPTEAWRGELPGLGKSTSPSRSKGSASSGEKMKIAWRYESLGGGNNNNNNNDDGSSESTQGSAATSETFCHTFDLGKRLQSSEVKGELHATASMPAMTWLQGTAVSTAASPLETFIANLTASLRASTPGAIHRVLVPSLLSPTLYGSSVCRPSDALRFLHKLRGLLRQYSANMTVIVSLSTSLYPRSTGLTRWMELLSDGVLELLPLQRKVHMQPNAKSEDVVQGMLKVHSLPIYHERGGGLEGQSSRENLSFRLSGSNGLIFKPYSLPPLLDEEDGKNAKETGKKEEKLDF